MSDSGHCRVCGQLTGVDPDDLISQISYARQDVAHYRHRMRVGLALFDLWAILLIAAVLLWPEPGPILVTVISTVLSLIYVVWWYSLNEGWSDGRQPTRKLRELELAYSKLLRTRVGPPEHSAYDPFATPPENV